MDKTLQTTIATTQYGTVTYERGIEVVDVVGYVEITDQWVMVYGDPDQSVDGQRRTVLRAQRVIEMDLRPER